MLSHRSLSDWHNQGSESGGCVRLYIFVHIVYTMYLDLCLEWAGIMKDCFWTLYGKWETLDVGKILTQSA